MKIAHDGKNKPLAVRYYGYTLNWKPEEDSGWQEYKRAFDLLYGHKKITKALEKIGYI